MSDTNELELLVLECGLFPDSDTVEQAISKIDGYRIRRVRLDDADLSSEDWDQLLINILESEKVVTL